MADNWRRICAAFNFDPAGRTLNRIDQKFPNRPEDCCREKFQTWLKIKGATWMCLVTILECSGEGLLADFVKTYAGIIQGEACLNRHMSCMSFEIIFTGRTPS